MKITGWSDLGNTVALYLHVIQNSRKNYTSLRNRHYVAELSNISQSLNHTIFSCIIESNISKGHHISP